MRGETVVCFAKDWSEDPTSCNHVMRQLAAKNRVIWLNSISTRAPSLTSGRDLRKIATKLTAFFRGPIQVEHNLWVFTPLLLPLHDNALATRLNRWILRLTVRVLQRKLAFQDFQLWTFVPTSSDYVGALGEKLLVYYCTDNWSSFSFADPLRSEERMRDLATKADLVFATSETLVEKLRGCNEHAYLASHGVDYGEFSRATAAETVVPDDIAQLPRPVIGYFGLVEDWLDVDLVSRLAVRHPEWSIVLIGRVCVDVSSLEKLTNVHFLGRKPHHLLPAYCKAFSVGLIPHKVNDLTRHMNPIKLREYLSAGVPVVSTALPAVRHYSEHCRIAETHEEFERAVADVLESETHQSRTARSESMASETWERKVDELTRHVAEAKGRRVQTGSCGGHLREPAASM